MSRTSELRNLAAFTAILVVASALSTCAIVPTKPQVYDNSNKSEVKPTPKTTRRKRPTKRTSKPVKVSVLKQRGYRFWLRGQPSKIVKTGFIKSRVRYDELRLKPGVYMIGFVRTTPRVGGAAYCKLEGGKTYSFKVVGRQYLPKSGTYGFLGKCFFDPERKENTSQK